MWDFHHVCRASPQHGEGAAEKCVVRQSCGCSCDDILVVTRAASFSFVAAIIKNVWLYINFFCSKVNNFWRVMNAAGEGHYYQDKYIYEGNYIMSVLQLTTTSRLATPGPTSAHVTFPVYCEWFLRKQDKSKWCMLGGEGCWSLAADYLQISAVTSHVRVMHTRRMPCFAVPTPKSAVERASKLLCWGVLLAFKIKHVYQNSRELQVGTSAC